MGKVIDFKTKQPLWYCSSFQKLPASCRNYVPGISEYVDGLFRIKEIIHEIVEQHVKDNKLAD